MLVISKRVVVITWGKYIVSVEEDENTFLTGLVALPGVSYKKGLLYQPFFDDVGLERTHQRRRRNLKNAR